MLQVLWAPDCGQGLPTASWPAAWTHTCPGDYIFFVYSEIKLEINNKWEFSSVAQFCPTLCDPMDCSTPGLLVHHQLLELAQTHAHRVSDAINHLILCRLLLLPPSVFPSIRVFSNESDLPIMWPKYWSFSLGFILFGTLWVSWTWVAISFPF